MVAPDLGELDSNVVRREEDLQEGKHPGEKESGWTNPLSWSDDGHDDDLVVTQLHSHIRYDESEGPTMPDYGEADNLVVNREGDLKSGKHPGQKESGWTNPLSWADSGEDDESVLGQMHAKIRYDE